MLLNLATCNEQDLVFSSEIPHMSLHMIWENIVTSCDYPTIKLYLTNTNGYKEYIEGSEYLIGSASGSQLWQIYNNYTNNIIVEIVGTDCSAGTIIVNKNKDNIWAS